MEHSALSGHYGVRSALAWAGSGRGSMCVCVCVLISRDDMFALCPDANPCVCQHPLDRKPKFISLSCWYVGSPAEHDPGPRFVLSMCDCVYCEL